MPTTNSEIDIRKKALVLGDTAANVLHYVENDGPGCVYLWPEVDRELPQPNWEIMQSTAAILRKDYPIWIGTMHEIPVLTFWNMVKLELLSANDVQMIWVEEHDNKVVADLVELDITGRPLLPYWPWQKQWELGFHLRFDMISAEEMEQHNDNRTA